MKKCSLITAALIVAITSISTPSQIHSISFESFNKISFKKVALFTAGVAAASFVAWRWFTTRKPYKLAAETKAVSDCLRDRVRPTMQKLAQNGGSEIINKDPDTFRRALNKWMGEYGILNYISKNQVMTFPFKGNGTVFNPQWHIVITTTNRTTRAFEITFEPFTYDKKTQAAIKKFNENLHSIKGIQKYPGDSLSINEVIRPWLTEKWEKTHNKLHLNNLKVIPSEEGNYCFHYNAQDGDAGALYAGLLSPKECELVDAYKPDGTIDKNKFDTLLEKWELSDPQNLIARRLDGVRTEFDITLSAANTYTFIYDCSTNGQVTSKLNFITPELFNQIK